MTSFDDLFAEKAATPLLDTFGEWITYRPLNGPGRRIRAMVERFGMDIPLEAPELLGQHIEIEVRNDAVLGILASRFDSGGDTVLVPLVSGQQPTELRISNLLDAPDAGMLRFRCGL